ncbi:MAG TPA: malto-oligosyltrehalose trehalohydrolase, partial [Euzebyales bacterium]|nr:malto-oligosyltrehalose trehalohydrolase [Euzebyales bacterium]
MTAYPIRHGPVTHGDGTVTFRVWAPYAQQVELIRPDHAPRQLTASGRGWFAGRVSAAPGDRYGFRLDGGQTRPDPASLHQPDGVHGLSAVVDRAALPWSPAEQLWQPTPLSSAVIYELHVGAFTPDGTFVAAEQHLAAVRDLGVTHVEVMPVAAFNGARGWGYDGVCWYAVHEPYGGPEAFAPFIDACHRAGLAVILDVVYNHFGPSGSYHHEFGPYVTNRHITPWGPAINFDDAGADAVRAFVVDNALMWLADFHVDGLRLDAVHALHDGSATPILVELSAAVDRLSEQVGRPLALIAESDRQDPRTVLPRAAGGAGLTAQWLDDLHHAIHVTVTGERDGYYADYTGLPDVAGAYVRGFVYDGRWSEYRQRTVGAPLPPTVSGRRFVACTQNHDQIGNRARGRRLTVLTDEDRLRFAIGLLCLAPTVPMLFMGEEYGATTPFLFFSSHPEPELAVAVREGRREEFAAFTAFDRDEIPDPQAMETFAASVLDRTGDASPTGLARRRLWTDALHLRWSTPA